MTNSKRNIVVVLGVVAILALTATTWVVAQTTGTIYACVTDAGKLRIVADDTSCKPKETLLEWNIQGEKGDKGDPGDPGVLGFYVVEGTHVTCPPEEMCFLYAYCNEGDQLTGGGVRKASYYAYTDPGIAIAGMEPYFDTVQNKWSYYAAVTNKQASGESMWTVAICADIP